MNRNYCNESEKYIVPPGRKKKYFLKNKWFFSAVVIAVLAILYFINAYFAHENIADEVVNARVVRVIDGDTIDVYIKGETVRVRMIGIDAPESVSDKEEENSVFGEYASDYTKSNLKEGQRIYLTFDSEKYDMYERLLAYVWTDTNYEDIGNLYQYRMLEDGYAVVLKIEPNTKFYSQLHEIMQSAVEERRGLWADDIFYNENIIYQ